MIQPSFSGTAPLLVRRDILATLALGTAGFAIPNAMAKALADGTPNAHDWDWLVGTWDVWHRRLKERLVGDTRWEEFPGRSAFWRTLGGLGNVDDNVVAIPSGTYRGLTLRAFDPATGKWSIWWLDARDPTHLEPPVSGRIEGDSGVFLGDDTLRGKPIVARFRWLDIHSARPHWEQAFSPDKGRSWEVNWVNFFTRTAAEPQPMPRLESAPGDWNFLVGSWSVRHRRLKQRLVGSTEWEEFSGTLVNWPVLGGYGNVGDNVFDRPDGTRRGIGLRAYDPATKQWQSWWLDGSTPGEIGAPARGGFAGATGLLLSDDMQDGRPVKTRITWSRITPVSARWEQAMSTDGGQSWETNWVSDFTRRG